MEIVKWILNTQGESVMDAATFLPKTIRTMSLHQSLAIRNRMLPQSSLLRDQFGFLRGIYGDEQWILEAWGRP